MGVCRKPQRVCTRTQVGIFQNQEGGRWDPRLPSKKEEEKKKETKKTKDYNRKKKNPMASSTH